MKPIWNIFCFIIVSSLAQSVPPSHGDSMEPSFVSASRAKYVTDVLIMADIGHARENRNRFVHPWPMGKSAYEGAFSLYDGIRDLVVNQGVTPTAAFILGDVGYAGGDRHGLLDTRDAFQNYTLGRLSPYRLFPLIGNHDIHYLGCLVGEDIDPFSSSCYFGSEVTFEFKSHYQMTFEEWRRNWLAFFPGLMDRRITFVPPKYPPGRDGPYDWLPPMRYNVNLDDKSSIYFIAGLVSGSGLLRWNDDTPRASQDGLFVNGTEELECLFLQDSLNYGRKLGKTVFVYMTHNFDLSCKQWDLLRQVDVWVYGHKHIYWDNFGGQSILAQEDKYFPVQVLIGNGGFDEGMDKVVSFGRIWEEISPDDSTRVNTHFEIYDTCESNETCPSSDISILAHCWRACKAVTGGFDGGGGPRKAIKKNVGGPGISEFIYTAPRVKKDPWCYGLLCGPRKMRLGPEYWVGLNDCEKSPPVRHNKAFPKARCLVPVTNESSAAVFYFYDSMSNSFDREFSVRMALDDDVRGPIVRSDNIKSDKNISRACLFRGYGYYDVEGFGSGSMVPSDGWRLNFRQDEYGSTQVTNAGWIYDSSWPNMRLGVAEGVSLDVFFEVLPNPKINTYDSTEFDEPEVYI